MIYLSMDRRREVTLCNHNFSHEGIFHPDRIMDEYDLLFMQNGEWDICEDGITYKLVPGSVLLLEPGKHHYSETKCSTMMRNVYIHFKADPADIPLGRESTACVLPETGSALLPGSITPPGKLGIAKLTQTAEHKDVHHAFERVIDAFWSPNDDNRKLVCSLCLEALLLRLSELGNSSSDKADILVSEIIHRFHCEPERFLSPDELAADYHVSVRTISGRFKAQTGMSIHRYQMQLKLNMAYDILPISPGRSLHDIALSYGFYDEFQFSKLFKRTFGISPSERR